MKSLPIALLALLLQSATASQQSGSASIEGVVVKIGASEVRLQFSGESTTGSNSRILPGTGEPLSGATVELTGIMGDRVRSLTVRTGRDGKFAFRDVPPGAGYQLIAIHSPEHLPAQYGQRSPLLPGTPITLAPGQQLKEVRIALTPAGGISGRVQDSGKPATARVVAIRPFYVDGRRVLGSVSGGKTGVVATTTANSRGEYRFSGLLPGQYYICANVALSTCHAKGDRPEPEPVHLRGGENLNGINISFRSGDRGRLRGQIVSGVTGAPVMFARIGLVPSAAVPNPPATPLRDSPSTFDVNAVPGSYYLIATEAPGGNDRPTFGFTPVNVRGSGDQRLRVVVEPAFNISGEIAGDGAADAVVSLLPLIPGMPRAPEAGVSLGGGFTLRDATPGEYRVNVMVSRRDSYVKSMRFGGRDLPDGILRIATLSNNRLMITLGSNPAVVSGRVLNERQIPIANIRAVLVPDAARRARADLYRDVLSGDAGEFQLQGVAPGDYKLFAWELVQEGAWQDPDFIRLYEDLGRPVRVTEEAAKTFDIPLIPAWD